MPTMNRKQFDAANAQCSNGFKLDLTHYLNWGDKQAQRYVPLTDDNKLDFDANLKEAKRLVQFVIWWTECRDEKQNAYGQTFSVPNGLYVPEVHVSVWNVEPTGVLVSRGMGHKVSVEFAQQKRRNFKVLGALTQQFDNQKLEEIWQEVSVNG